MHIFKLVALPALAVGLILGAPAAARATESVTYCARWGPESCPPQDCDVSHRSEKTRNENGTTTQKESRFTCVRSDTFHSSGAAAIAEAVAVVVGDVLSYVPE